MSNTPVILHFKNYLTSIKWMAEHAFDDEKNQKYKQKGIDDTIRSFTKIPSEDDNQDYLARDKDRARIYVKTDETMDEKERQSKIQSTKEFVFHPWKNENVTYTQGDFGGGPYLYAFKRDCPSLVIMFAYVSDHGEICGIFIDVTRNDPNNYIISISKNNNLLDKRECKLFYDPLFYSKVDAPHIAPILKSKPVLSLQETQKEFFDYLDSKDLAEEFANLFQTEGNDIIINRDLVSKFVVHTLPLPRHIYHIDPAMPIPELTTPDLLSPPDSGASFTNEMIPKTPQLPGNILSPLEPLSSKLLREDRFKRQGKLSEEDKVQIIPPSPEQVRTYYFLSALTGSSISGGAAACILFGCVVAGVLSFGIGFFAGIAGAALLGAIGGIYKAYKDPLPTETKVRTYPKDNNVDLASSDAKAHSSTASVQNQFSFEANNKNTPLENKGALYLRRKSRTKEIPTIDSLTQEMPAPNYEGFDHQAFTTFDKNAKQTPKETARSIFKVVEEFPKSYTVLDDSVRLKK